MVPRGTGVAERERTSKGPAGPAEADCAVTHMSAQLMTPPALRIPRDANLVAGLIPGCGVYDYADARNHMARQRRGESA